MADATVGPSKAARKKKLLAFLKPEPKPAPTHDEDFDFTQDGCDKAKQAADVDDGLDMFRRSKDCWDQFTKKDDDKSFATTPKPKVEDHKHTTLDSDEEPVPSSSRSSKRRKLSVPEPTVDSYQTESYDDLYGPATPPRHSTKSVTPVPRRKQPTPAIIGSKGQASPSTRKSKGKGKESIDLVQSDLLPSPTSRSNSHQLSADVVALDDDEGAMDEGQSRIESPCPRKATAETPLTTERYDSPILLEDSDDEELIDNTIESKKDEFEHFIIAARKRQEEAARAAAAAAAENSSEDEADPSALDEKGARNKKQVAFGAVKMFVNSRIAAHADPGSGPFGCHRKVEQSLGPVKKAFLAWLFKGQVPPEDEERVFLTWKGHRILDSVSLMGLGCEMDSNGRLRAPKRTLGYYNGGVLMEAWTQEDYERHEAEQERQRLVARGDLAEESGAVEVDDEDDNEAEPQVAKVKLFLKEKDKDPFPLSTYVDTPIRVLIGAYRKQQEVPADREIRLLFDGEWLEPLMTVGEADIEEQCTIEVYLR